jgi:hypothetical protein
MPHHVTTREQSCARARSFKMADLLLLADGVHCACLTAETFAEEIPRDLLRCDIEKWLRAPG